MRPVLLALLLSVICALPGAAQQWALGGHDPVGYHQDQRAVPGRSDIATMWRGKLWHFASEANRSRFEADPRRFAPAFGGLCPVSLAEGRRHEGDPQHFVILGGQLFLLRSGRDARALRTDPDAIIGRARQVWQQMK